MENRTSTVGNFFSGFMRGAGTGLLMMGIFSAVSLGAGALGLMAMPSIGYIATALGIGTATTGIFSGIMATGRGTPVTHSPTGAANLPSRGPARAPEAVITPIVAADRAESPATGWTDRVGRSGNSTIANIIADGSMSDKNRASAILAAREAADKQTSTTR